MTVRIVRLMIYEFATLELANRTLTAMAVPPSGTKEFGATRIHSATLAVTEEEDHQEAIAHSVAIRAVRSWLDAHRERLYSIFAKTLQDLTSAHSDEECWGVARAMLGVLEQSIRQGWQ